ncbi:MAG: hypothetical protein ACOX6Q_02265 [Candidatus Dojkabacteria bacterium]
MSSTTVKLEGVSRGDEYRKKIAPENIVLTKEESPNFSNSIAKWNYSTPLLGKITAEVFDSNNGKLRYIFCRNEFGASWIANIEVNNSEITSTGLKKEWVYSPDLTTPPIERGQQTDVYFGEKISGTKYYDMYKNYLSKIPVIQEYEKYLAAK